MIAEQETLLEMLTRALAHADVDGDTLIAALLSQCIALLEDRESATH